MVLLLPEPRCPPAQEQRRVDTVQRCLPSPEPHLPGWDRRVRRRPVHRTRLLLDHPGPGAVGKPAAQVVPKADVVRADRSVRVVVMADEPDQPTDPAAMQHGVAELVVREQVTAWRQPGQQLHLSRSPSATWLLAKRR